MNKRSIGIVLFSLMMAHFATAVTWLAGAADNAAWSNGANWDLGHPPLITDLALFNTAQTYYNVNVDAAAVTRLMQVSSPQTFNATGGGTLLVAAALSAQLQNVMYNTVSGGTVTYNVPVTFNNSSASGYWAQARNQSTTPGTMKFNNGLTIVSTSAAGLNLDQGMFEINGNLTMNDGLRLGAGTVVKIGGSGTTAIGGPGYIQTSGGELQLNRTGAFTVVDPLTGYLRVEQTKVVFGAANATGAGTNVKLYQTVDTGMLLSGGDYDQNFGYLAALGASTATDIDMANSASTWTFADSSAISWNNLTIANVDTTKTVIRFALGTGGGLTDTQIGKITLNGTVLTTGDTTVDGGYLYVTQAIPEPATLGMIGMIALGLLAWRRIF